LKLDHAEFLKIREHIKSDIETLLAERTDSLSSQICTIVDKHMTPLLTVVRSHQPWVLDPDARVELVINIEDARNDSSLADIRWFLEAVYRLEDTDSTIKKIIEETGRSDVREAAQLAFELGAIVEKEMANGGA
jgi:hypothetical protein